MTAADRPSVTDTTGVQVGDPDPWTGDYEMCDTRMSTRFICTAPTGHSGPHVAAGTKRVVSVEQQPRPSVTDNARAEQSATLADADAILTAALSLDPTGYRIEGAYSAARLATALRAAGRAETTTATDEDAAQAAEEAIEEALYANDLVRSGGIDGDQYIVDGLLGDVVRALAGLLATARTRPTREQIARGIFLADRADTLPDGFAEKQWDEGHAGEVVEAYYRRADAVLALFDQGGRL